MQSTLERLRQRRQELGKEQGFTLIELLIVIVILGILAAIVVFAVQNLTGSSAQAACQSDYKTVESAAEAFKAQTGAYPGGTYNTEAKVTAVTAPSGYSVTASTDGVDYLLQKTDTLASKSIGPWLKDAPVNSGHYEIVLSTDGNGTVSVYTSNGATATSCSSVS